MISNEDILEEKAAAYQEQLAEGRFNLPAPQLPDIEL